MSARRAPALATVGMSKTFGSLVALDDVSLSIAAGSFHALLGENGAGKSTLVKCMMGYDPPTRGALLLDGAPIKVRSPRDARRLGIGMVHQHFTLAPALTAAENFVISRADAPAVIDWAAEKKKLAAFMDRMPLRVPLDRPARAMSAGEKQKVEILKLLYLDQRFLILDEPTSVLTPAEADEVLGLLKGMTTRGEITVLMITHKLREVTAFAQRVSVLRRGRHVGGGDVGALSTDDMARLMVGEAAPPPVAMRKPHAGGPVRLAAHAVSAMSAQGPPVLDAVSLGVRAGEILGVAGVAGNGQTALVEVLMGQRAIDAGAITIDGEPFAPTRRDFARFKVFGLPEEPMRNAVAARMSVAENIAFRSFDKAPFARWGFWLAKGAMRAHARDLITRYRVKTASPDAAMETLSGGNVQRVVLARELSGDVDVLVVANPCFGLDFASVRDIRAQIMEQRNRGAAVLLVSEDLDEILELADAIVVMSQGRIAYRTMAQGADRMTIGRHMAGLHA